MPASSDIQHIVQCTINELNVDTMYTETYKKQIGRMHLAIKDAYGKGGDLDELGKLHCKGKHSRKVSTHQASQGASVYALQYYYKEGFTWEVAMVHGCLLWNTFNKCAFFKCNLAPQCKTKLVSDIVEDDDVDVACLQKMCRVHHKKANLKAIEDLRYTCGPKNNPKVRPLTYWMCFDEAIESIPAKEDITKKNVRKALRMWNKKNGIALFTLKN